MRCACLLHQLSLGTSLPTHEGIAQADSAPRWVTRPKTVTHPGTNRACRRVTALIETNLLLLSQTDTQPNRSTQPRSAVLQNKSRHTPHCRVLPSGELNTPGVSLVKERSGIDADFRKRSLTKPHRNKHR